MAGEPPDDNGSDWRRRASDRNVSGGVARALWDQARSAAPDDPAHAEHMYELMLDEAAAANVTHEPGRETLASATANARDAAAAGPGKHTRVLLEQPRPAAAPGKLTADDLRNELTAAMQAGKSALAGISASDPATLVEALRALQGQPLPGPLQKVLGAAGNLVERALAHRDANAASKPGVPTSGPTGGTAGASASPASAASTARATAATVPSAPAPSTDRRR